MKFTLATIALCSAFLATAAPVPSDEKPEIQTRENVLSWTKNYGEYDEATQNDKAKRENVLSWTKNYGEYDEDAQNDKAKRENVLSWTKNYGEYDEATQNDN
jgi:hypothetical protein